MEKDTLKQLLEKKRKLIKQVMLLPDKYQKVFTALICERLIPNYKAFGTVYDLNNGVILEDALQLVWGFLENRVDKNELHQSIELVKNLMPRLEEYNSALVELAACTVDAVSFTIESCIVSQNVEIVSNTVEMLVIATETYLRDVALPYTSDFISQDKASYFDQWIWASPLLTDELDYQQQTIDKLSTKPELTVAFLDALKIDAQRSGICLFERGFVREN